MIDILDVVLDTFFGGFFTGRPVDEGRRREWLRRRACDHGQAAFAAGRFREACVSFETALDLHRRRRGREDPVADAVHLHNIAIAQFARSAERARTNTYRTHHSAEEVALDDARTALALLGERSGLSTREEGFRDRITALIDAIESHAPLGDLAPISVADHEGT